MNNTYKEKVLEPVHNWVYGQNWLPVFSEDIETNVPLQVNVRVVDFRLAFNLRYNSELEENFIKKLVEPWVAREGRLLQS